MIFRSKDPKRRGATVVEFALVMPFLFLMLFGTIIGGLGVYRYQRVANMARDAARYASVHSAQWALDFNSGKLLTAQDIYNATINGNTAGFDVSDIAFGSDLTNVPTNHFVVVVQYDNSSQATVYIVTNSDGTVSTIYNQVKVLVRYTYKPEIYWGTMTLQSQSNMRMCYEYPKS